MNSYKQLKLIFKRYYHLQAIQMIMMWDEAVIMPEGAGHTRGETMATLGRTTQKLLIRRKNKALFDAAKQDKELSSWDAANLRWMEKKYVAATCIPLNLTEEFTKATMASEQAWRKCRAQNNWREFQPYLEKTFRLAKEIAERKSQVLNLSTYDVLIDEYAPGFQQQSIDGIFDQLKKSLPPLLHQIRQKQSHDVIELPIGPFAIEKQKQLGLDIMRAMQFDFQHGRLDVSHHPFCGGAADDIRLTTRYRDDDFLSSLMGVCHETGHALYEQGLPKKWMFQPVGHVNSMAMHESQSLLLEMEVCRSKQFIEFLLPFIQDKLGKQQAVSIQNLYKLTTVVKPDYIRVDADEVTYPLHIILRYELEKELMNGDITVKDLPARWDEFMTRYLGISTKNNDKEGVMQDVHWPSGAFGYFPAYTLGRMIAAQLFSTFMKQFPGFFDEVKSGNFKTLFAWLKQHVYNNASKLPIDEFLMSSTGEGLNPHYFIDRLQQRYL